LRPMPSGIFRIIETRIDTGQVIAAIEGPDAGAVALFVGNVRGEDQGRRVLRLEYDAYAPMAERVMAGIGEEIVSRFGDCRVAMVHRIGRLEVGETSVVVAVAAAHRSPALEACRYGIERLKAVVPIWKKQCFEEGEVWLENPIGSHEHEP